MYTFFPFVVTFLAQIAENPSRDRRGNHWDVQRKLGHLLRRSEYFPKGISFNQAFPSTLDTALISISNLHSSKIIEIQFIKNVLKNTYLFFLTLPHADGSSILISFTIQKCYRILHDFPKMQK